MGLTTIFAAFPDLLGPQVSFVGPEAESYVAKPPRIQWTPGPARHLLPDRIGGGPGDDGTILRRQWEIRVAIWDESLDATQALADKFLAAAHDLLTKHSYQPGDENWDMGGVSSKGVVCLMTFFVVVPVLRTRTATRPITEVSASYLMNETAV